MKIKKSNNSEYITSKNKNYKDITYLAKFQIDNDINIGNNDNLNYIISNEKDNYNNNKKQKNKEYNDFIIFSII